MTCVAAPQVKTLIPPLPVDDGADLVVGVEVAVVPVLPGARHHVVPLEVELARAVCSKWRESMSEFFNFPAKNIGLEYIPACVRTQNLCMSVPPQT